MCSCPAWSLPAACIRVESGDAIRIAALSRAGQPAVISEGFETGADAAVRVVPGDEEEEEDGEDDGGGYAVADAVVALCGVLVRVDGKVVGWGWDVRSWLTSCRSSCRSYRSRRGLVAVCGGVGG